MAEKTGNARLAREDADYARFAIKRGTPEPWEDGLRTHGGKGSYEWWYTDAEFDDGTTVVTIFFSKGYFDVPGPAHPTVDIEVTDASGNRTNVFTQGPKGTPVTCPADRCDISIEKCFIRYENGNYLVHYEDHGIVYDATMSPTMSMWRPFTGHYLFDDNTSEHLFAWFVAVPEAIVEATLTMDGVTRTLKGKGYHDHNWGDISMDKLMNHWYWGRAKVGDYNVIACDIIAEKRYGNKRIPIFMLAKDGVILSDDNSITKVERADTHINDFSHKFMDDTLVYTQHVSDDEEYIVKFHRTHDILHRSLLEVVSPVKRVIAKALRLNPTYIRIAGEVSVDVRTPQLQESIQQTGLWEQYFMGSNKLATIEGVTYPAS